MNRIRKIAVVIVALGSVSVAQASPISISTLFDESDTQSEYLRAAGHTQYVFFQANADLHLLQTIMFGTPVNFVQGTSQFRWQLFQTDENFETPNGNDDRVWLSDQISFDDMGTANYVTGAGVFLEESAYYWLSFQILNVDWLQTAYIRDVAKPPTFLSSDGLFTIFGENSIGVPGGSDFPALSLRVRTVPEPGTLVLLGLGLVGMAATRRRRKA